ncbi:Pyruvate/Phosphoenolpyruvate kinase-like domain-containing protein [Fomitopsis serialis]|uniref:Pyruvate/Phosphoenolpyruvate kinase-like domain-containing protein n=1 Tax=Fomitopsis serialis TaxID=139415 RepID=UPI0020089422|nr:Pyruvate/Phosphoenolpyruvate kinase-like domain-containing protein [Neoantrodia serialis]KAH9936260.1 Pyruvate/Phosphoenolpyruvate kinase-like domain-containing protein [Neoantrodia serialis]
MRGFPPAKACSLASVVRASDAPPRSRRLANARWQPLRTALRTLSTASRQDGRTQLNRSYLYVPAASERMLQKSLVTNSDIIIYDLEDSVPPTKSDKEGARERLVQFLRSKPQAQLPFPERVAVRLNSTNTPFFEGDLAAALQVPSIRTLVLPKVHSVQDLHHVSRMVYSHSQLKTTRDPEEQPLQLVASIESARALVNLGTIAGWHQNTGPLSGSRCRVAVRSRRLCVVRLRRHVYHTDEVPAGTLYTRSQIAITAKAFGLDAIDMVCVNYKDLDYLKEECEDGRRLGFNGKQAIHPTQVDIIQSTFVPTEQEILRAARIVKKMEQAHGAQRGAIGLELEGGGKEMIDAPMLKQAENTVRIAKAAGLHIPDVQ